jgi:antitoxin CcdA
MWNHESIPTTRLQRESFDCDRCGVKHESTIAMQEAVTINIFGGYGSVFGDESQLEAVLCQDCVKAVLGDYLRDMSF